MTSKVHFIDSDDEKKNICDQSTFKMSWQQSLSYFCYFKNFHTLVIEVELEQVRAYLASFCDPFSLSLSLNYLPSVTLGEHQQKAKVTFVKLNMSVSAKEVAAGVAVTVASFSLQLALVKSEPN